MSTLASFIRSGLFRNGLVVVSALLLAAVSGCSKPDTVKPATDLNSSGTLQEGDYRAKYQAAIESMKSKHYEESERLFLELVRDKPQLAGPYCNLAIIYFNNGKYDQSLSFVNKAIGLDGAMPQAYNLRAQIDIKKGKIKDAERDYLEAVKINPKYANGQYNLALLYDIYYQDVAKAIEHYELYQSLLEQPDEQTKEWVEHLKGSLKHG